MKVTHSAVYKLAVEAECGCKASGEFLDPAYHEPGPKKFESCEVHKGAEGVGGILLEVMVKEAQDYGNTLKPVHLPAPAPVTLPPMTPSPRTLERAGDHRPAAERPKSIPPFHRVDPMAGPRLRAVAAQAPRPSKGNDLHGVEEDHRLTHLLERTGLLDPEEEAEDLA